MKDPRFMDRQHEKARNKFYKLVANEDTVSIPVRKAVVCLNPDCDVIFAVPTRNKLQNKMTCPRCGYSSIMDLASILPPLKTIEEFLPALPVIENKTMKVKELKRR